MPPHRVEGRRPARRALAVVRVLPMMMAIGAVQAQPQATSDYLALMDTDGDGRVSLAEYQAWMLYAFDRMDVNGDGRLDPHEQPGGGRGRVITREAYRAQMAERFNRQDANGDGYLDARELAAPPL
ncbi:hypothetical protein [Luteimonas abyssi]|uniref:EF-hand domain-containing protein n=1 Tax=Luteimonas abyssi TaxID=1247514 RepID=UPI000737C774